MSSNLDNVKEKWRELKYPPDLGDGREFIQSQLELLLAVKIVPLSFYIQQGRVDECALRHRVKYHVL